MTPYFLKTVNNQAGVDVSAFDGIRAALNGDRLAFLSSLFDSFYNADVLRGALRWLRVASKNTIDMGPFSTLGLHLRASSLPGESTADTTKVRVE